MPPVVVAVVLAAGGGRRFAGTDHKLLARWRGRPLFTWALENAAAAGLDQTWLITGAVDLVAGPSITVLHNQRWAEGQATSVRLAVAAAAARPEIEALVLGLGDQPLVPASAWRAVAGATDRPIAVATYGGRRRNPVRVSRECWPLLPASGDGGARTLMRQRPDLVMTVPCDGDPADIDTLDDLARLA